MTLSKHGQGTLQVAFDQPSLVGYLSTQSSVLARIQEDFGFNDAQLLIDSTLPVVLDTQAYVYGYSYSICKATLA